MLAAMRAEFQKEKWQVVVKGPLGDERMVGELKHGEIKKLFERKVGKDFKKTDQALAHLVGTGEIVEVWKPGQRGKKTRYWQWQG